MAGLGVCGNDALEKGFWSGHFVCAISVWNWHFGGIKLIGVRFYLNLPQISSFLNPYF
jgi:hypothetical protein